MNKLLTLCIGSFLLLCIGCREKPRMALITTDYGSITIALYDSTPIHKKNFIKLVEEGFYNGLTFHRIEPGFVIQGGDPHSHKNSPEPMRGNGGPGYKLPAEIGKKHTYGAVGMARNNNPQKRSNGSQFYIITGEKYTLTELEQIAEQKGITYTPEQLTIYEKLGGAPHLDNRYTVFGHVLDGMDVVKEIQEAKRENPTLAPVYMNIKMLN